MLPAVSEVFTNAKEIMTKAMENFERDLELCEELGDKQGIAIALGLIGELHSIMGNFHKSVEYLQKNLMLCEELGYQKGIAKAVNTLAMSFSIPNNTTGPCIFTTGPSRLPAASITNWSWA